MAEISVIVPVYRTEAYLRRCIDSILAQTLSDIELILVDDGSPDGCPGICDEYAQKDPRVCVIHKENGGVSSARNAGIRIASGRYIMFCDSDDCVSPRWCEALYRQAEQTPDAFIYADLIRSEGLETVQLPTVCIGHPAQTDYYECYTRGLSAYVCNKIYAAAKLKSEKLLFDEAVCLSEDVVFNLYYLRSCKGCIYIPEQLYVYTQRDESCMHSYEPDWFRMHLAPFYERIPYIGEENIAAYCDGWLYSFLVFFRNVFDERNPATWKEKMAYNQRMLTSKEFQYCLHHATGKKENPIVLKILKTKSYLLFYLFEKAVLLKRSKE